MTKTIVGDALLKEATRFGFREEADAFRSTRDMLNPWCFMGC